MNKKLYAQLALAMLVGNYVVADGDGFFNRVGRTLNGNGAVALTTPAEKVSLRDAKDLKKQMRTISKNVSSLSAAKKEAVKNKIRDLDYVVKSNQVAKKGKVKKYQKQ